ncbi:hypothetical protein [Halosimplex pelagicum]|uniref:Uncharacterized protein n=1 Tax=Halosimplex pelagicum TaxID=869886 RepID=A0A7D5P712_9EURY|nr:hypothetical protein [Halosimplex pelagicum]QLH82323.1 hypothetical protein HZS54_12175 [Halosimplex pelagicum]
MTSDTAQTDTTLEQFELAGKPTDISEVEETADADVVEAFNQIKRFKSQVQLNGRDRALLVGRSTGRNPSGYRLYHRPEAEGVAGFAGTLLHKRSFQRDRDDEHTVAFNPAGSEPSEETIVEPIRRLNTEEHTRTERLDGVLNEIRTALTDSDWIENGRADTSYGEWIQAVNELADFINDLEDRPEQFPTRAVMESKIMHGIARYPLNAEDLLAQTSDCLRENLDGGLFEASPEAFRTLLLRYAEQKGVK